MVEFLRAVCGDSYLLLANEIMRSRAGVLADNVAIWGDPCVAVSSLDPAAFAALPEFFDIIIADVPCSGEGMFRKDFRAREQWSVDNVALCAQRQRRIVADVWPALRPGGLFIYSTCTFNRQENDGNVEWIRDNLGAGVLDLPLGYEGLIATEYGCSLVPGFVPGEGQYCAALRKEGEPSLRGARTPGRARPVRTADRRSADCVDSLFGIPVSVRVKGISRQSGMWSANDTSTMAVLMPLFSTISTTVASKSPVCQQNALPGSSITSRLG